MSIFKTNPRRDQAIADQYLGGHVACNQCQQLTEAQELMTHGARCLGCYETYLSQANPEYKSAYMRTGGTAKVTGTGSGGDYWSMVDSGATCVVDFTDAGYSATYKLSLPCLEEIMRDLVHHLANERMDVILIEVADGILQEQNVDFILSPVFQDLVDGIFFAAGEAMGAALGVNRLMALGLPLVGVSGKLTASELLIREAQHAFEVPVYRKEQLADPVLIGEILQLNEHNRIQAGADSIFAFPDTPVHQEALVEMRSIA